MPGWNGKEYNQYHTEGYRISMEVYGDHCINLYYRTRNDSMLAHINKALARHNGEKIVVVTGAEHKHYFDRALKKRKNTVIHNLKSFTIEEKPIEEERIQKYRWIRGGGFTLLLHGPDMDFHPYRIPGENIQKASRLLKRLEKEYGHMPDFVFEQGWVDFLIYSQARATALRYGNLPEWKEKALYERWLQKPYTHEE